MPAFFISGSKNFLPIHFPNLNVRIKLGVEIRQLSHFEFHSPDHPDNRQFVDIARREMGSEVQIQNYSRDFGRLSIVWRLVASDGSRVWLKHHESSRQFERELIGLELCIPALGDQTWWSSPILVAMDRDAEVILMTEVEGEILDTAVTSTDEDRTMFRLAGRFIRKLHDLASSGSDETIVPINLKDRSEHYLSVGEASIDAETMRWARALVDQACLAGNLGSVHCHRDFSPRNWLINRRRTGIQFGVIDWERTGQDVWLQDLQRMVHDHWHHKPQLRDAFYEGYGHHPTDLEQLQLDAICLVGAIASISWADRHHDANFSDMNRKIIARIRARH